MFGFLDDLVSSPTGGLFGELLFGERRHDRAVNAANAQMAFQERMRDTQMQSRVKDLQAAGLNPMLGYSQGGAVAPAGAMAAMQSEGGGLLSSASGARKVHEELLNLRQQRKLLEEETRGKKFDADIKEGPAALGRQAGKEAEKLPAGVAAARAAVTDVIERVVEDLVPAVGQSARSVRDRAVGRTADVMESVGNVVKALPEKVKSLLFPSAEQAKRRKELETAVIPPARRRFDAGEPGERRRPRMRGKLGGAENY